jgi:hypothetical protein
MWMKVDERERARLNLYKAMIGVNDANVTDQTASLRALLDTAGVPSVPVANQQQPEAVAP